MSSKNIMNPRAASSISASVMLVTPARASLWLENRHQNRPIRQRVVDLYVEDFVANEWYLTNQGIGLDKDGRLVDGQHRLTALVQANLSVEMLVITGVEHSVAIRAVDNGPSRTAGQRLTMTGELNSNIKAAVCRSVHLLMNPAVAINSMISQGDVQRTLDEYRDQVEMVAFNTGMRTRIPAVVRAASVVMIQRLPEYGVPFYEGLATGAGLREGDPRLLLRNWCMARQTARALPADLWSRTISAADLFMHGESAKKASSSAKARYARFASSLDIPVNPSIMALVSR